MLALLLALSVGGASAQTSQFSLIVGPSQAYLKILPGNKATHTITLENSGNQTLEVTPKILDFITDGKTGIPVLLGKTEFAYLDMTDSLFRPISLAPKTKAQLTLSFSVPPGAKNKEYPLSILFTTEKLHSSLADNRDNPSPVSGSVVSNLVVLVSDDSVASKKIALKDLAAPKFIDSFGQIEFAPVVQNEGYAATIASGSASINDFRGKKLAEFPLYPDSILGFSSRELRSYTAADLTPRLFNYNPPFLIGPYKVVVEIDNSTETQQEITTEYTTVIALPFSLLGAAGLGIATYFVYTKILKKITL